MLPCSPIPLKQTFLAQFVRIFIISERTRRIEELRMKSGKVNVVLTVKNIDVLLLLVNVIAISNKDLFLLGNRVQSGLNTVRLGYIVGTISEKVSLRICVRSLISEDDKITRF